MSTGTLPPAGEWIRGISIKQPWTTHRQNQDDREPCAALIYG
jgi:hypothetical protein